MSGTVVIKVPAACTEDELQAFEALVRESGEVVERGLPVRVRAAACLAFYYARPGDLAAIAALKVPHRSYRDRVFRKSRTRRWAEGYPVELGWFFVRPPHRGRRLSALLASRLLTDGPDHPVFATTRTDNRPMLAVLESLGFERTGTPYSRDSLTHPHDQLVLLVRPARRHGTRGESA